MSGVVEHALSTSTDSPWACHAGTHDCTACLAKTLSTTRVKHKYATSVVICSNSQHFYALTPKSA
jgi:transcription elongation factor Elf1